MHRSLHDARHSDDVLQCIMNRASGQKVPLPSKLHAWHRAHHCTTHSLGKTRLGRHYEYDQHLLLLPVLLAAFGFNAVPPTGRVGPAYTSDPEGGMHRMTGDR